MLDSLEMLCSTTTARSSASNWLERLRSSKGFPTAENLHLDHFLTNTNCNDSPSALPTTNASNSAIISNSESTQSDDKRASATANSDISSTRNEWVGIMTNILSDLFNMGSSGGESKERVKKAARKQINPKFCDIATPASGNSLIFGRKEQNVLASASATASSSFNRCDEDSNNGNDGDDLGVVEEDEDKEMLKGYSRSEVTVIDTSCQVWKFDKLVFRRKNVWKVRDRKGKSSTVGPMKRKPVHLDSANANGVSKKKAKAPDLEYPVPDGKPQDKKREAAYKETPDGLGEVPKKRFHFSRSPRKLKKGGSSVVLTSGVSSGKTNGRNVPMNGKKDSQRQHKAQ